ncbi:MAG: carbohydrate porin [Candidatus Omnitrophica bacterium]|nr:carbohydrate porin [Candidatus Omnitrophota bacterium]
MKLSIRLFLFTALFLSFCPRFCFSAPLPLEISKEMERIPGKKEWGVSFAKLREELSQKYGTEFYFLLNYQQQEILYSKHDTGNSRMVWYWNLEFSQRLWKGALLNLELEVDKNKGVDKLIPTFSMFNSNSGENASLYIPRLLLTQNLYEDKLQLSAGKLDLSDWFDCNNFANSADIQFLSDALTNSLTIPFPAKGLGAMASFTPNNWFYLQAGASTANAVSTKVGLSNGFNSTFFINEFGFTPKLKGLKGNYRFIFNLNREKLPLIDDEGEKRSQFGFSISFDQEIVKDKLGLFLRYGFADRRVYEIADFWSCGLQLNEPLAGRKYDFIGFGVAQSLTGENYRKSDEPNIAHSETMYEFYYSYHVNNAFILTPNLQVVVNPYADKTSDCAAVCGLRGMLSF